MAYDSRKIANSYYLPKHPFLHGIARMMDFGGLLNRQMFAQILERSDADSMRADWEAVGTPLAGQSKRTTKKLRKRLT